MPHMDIQNRRNRREVCTHPAPLSLDSRSAGEHSAPAEDASTTVCRAARRPSR